MSAHSGLSTSTSSGWVGKAICSIRSSSRTATPPPIAGPFARAVTAGPAAGAMVATGVCWDDRLPLLLGIWLARPPQPPSHSPLEIGVEVLQRLLRHARCGVRLQAVGPPRLAVDDD